MCQNSLKSEDFWCGFTWFESLVDICPLRQPTEFCHDVLLLSVPSIHRLLKTAPFTLSICPLKVEEEGRGGEF